MKTASVINSDNISGLVQRTLNHVDVRLTDHGKRVAYLAGRMLEADGSFSVKEKQDICLLALLHDIGAYKTEEINEMTRFESRDIWEHSIFGYLFLYHLSPLKDWAQTILFHHVSASTLDGVDERIAMASQIINLADRVDIFWLNYPVQSALDKYLSQKRDDRFRGSVVDLFYKALEKYPVMEEWKDAQAFQKVVQHMDLTVEQCEAYLNMLIFAIDFRSRHTVTHTITTTSIATSLARFMQMNEKQIHDIYYGALLHDLGKIGIPVEILEFPGKLSPQAMKIMRTHVDITEEILGGTIDPVITNIAIRHHEKLDGSGYPKGLCGDAITLEEQVVGVSDIVSALLGTRSYKEAYSKEKTLSILREQAGNGKISPELVGVLEKHFDEILSELNVKCAPILETYYGLTAEYDRLLEKYHNQKTFMPA